MSEEKVIRRNLSEPMISSYLHSKGVAKGIPICGNFELTSRCNFNCKMCYVHSQKDQKGLLKRELTADQWLSIASDARDAGMIFALLTGGEPFIRKDFAKIYEEMSKMGVLLSINTNASLYDDEIRELFKKYPPSRINVSLYGGSEHTYQSLCENPSYEKVIKNIKCMQEDHLQIRLNVTLTPYNIGDMKAIDEFSKAHDLHVKATTYMYPTIRLDGNIGTNPARFDAEESGKLMAAWDRLRESNEQFRMRAKKLCRMDDDSCDVEGNSQNNGVTCRAGRSSFWLTWDGKMLPCGMMDVPPVYVLKNGFTSAWEKVRQITKEICLPAECASCGQREVCSVCAANVKAETGVFDTKPEYICRLTNARCAETARLANLNE